MIEFAQNDWSQRDILDKIIILKKEVTYTLHAVILKKYHEYPLTKILKHLNVLAKVNKSPLGSLPNMMPHDAYSIIIYVHTVTLVEFSREKKE